MRFILGRMQGKRAGQQNLIVAFGIVLAIGLTLGGWVLIQDDAVPTTERESPGVTAASAHPALESPGQAEVIASRLIATRPDTELPPQSPDASTDGPSPPAAQSGSQPGDLDQQTANSEPPPESSSEKSDEEIAEQLRRILIRGKRRAHAGDPIAAVETTREISDYFSGEDRDNVNDNLDQMRQDAENGQNVDFDALIELIQNVIEPDSWADVGGGATIEEFPGGIFVDPQGVIERVRTAKSDKLDALREKAKSRSPAAGLRKVSLTRLEADVAAQLRRGKPLSDQMKYLAGLVDVRYLFVYPDDIVIAGPAEAWYIDEQGRPRGAETDTPILQLDDLVTLLRSQFTNTGGNLVCGIYPREKNLASVQRFLAAQPGSINPRDRDAWLEQLRQTLGLQDIKISGVPPGSRIGNVMVEADYRMKLIGIGLEEAAVEIPDYYELLGQPGAKTLNRPIDTLRWWFTIHEDATIESSAKQDAFEIPEGLVQVLSENELLTRTGQRVHTGKADPINDKFAESFTEKFEELAETDPTFGDLENVFDLTVVAALLREHQLPNRIDWTMDCFLDEGFFLTLQQPTPRAVETVMNHKVFNGRHILAVISGGVHIRPEKLVRRARTPESQNRLVTLRDKGMSDRRLWWWD